MDGWLPLVRFRRTVPVKNQNQIIVGGVRPLAVNKRTLVQVFGGASKLVDQMLYAARYFPEMGWLTVARQGSPGVECLIDTASAERAYQRYLHGDRPPPLPSEVRTKSKISPQNISAKTASRRN